MAGHPDEQMTIEVERSNDGALITLVGELDLATASQLYELFAELQREGGVIKVEVNLAGLTFMDSTGISTLVMEQKRLRASGGHLTVVDPPHNVVRIFQVSGVDKLLLGADRKVVNSFPCPKCGSSTVWAPEDVSPHTRICLSPEGCGYTWQVPSGPINSA